MSFNFSDNRTVPAYSPNHLSLGALKFKYFFDLQNFSTKLIIIFFVSICIGLCNFFIIERVGIYNLGITAVFQGFSRLLTASINNNSLDEQQLQRLNLGLVWGFNLLFNIPFSIFFFRKIGRKFTILSIFSISVISLTIITLNNLPQSWGLNEFYLFSNPQPTSAQNKTNHFLKWGDGGGNVFLIFVYGCAFGVINSFLSIFIYSVGGSTGGLDWWIFYVVKTQMKPVSKIVFFWSLTLFSCAYLLGSYIPFAMQNNNSTQVLISNILSPFWFSTAIAVLVKNVMFNMFYPQFKVVNVKIFTNEFFKLRQKLLESKFPHSHTINTHTGGYSLKKQYSIDIICFSLEFSQIMGYARNIDPHCFIVVIPIQALDGNFKTFNKWAE